MSLQNGNMGANTHVNYMRKYNLFFIINELLDFMVVPFYMGSFASIFSTLLLRQGVSSSGLKMLIKLGGPLLYVIQVVFLTCLVSQIVGAAFFTKDFKMNLSWHWSKNLRDDKGFFHFIRAVRNVLLVQSVFSSVRALSLLIAKPFLILWLPIMAQGMMTVLGLFLLLLYPIVFNPCSQGFLLSCGNYCRQFFFKRQGMRACYEQGRHFSAEFNAADLGDEQGDSSDELGEDDSSTNGLGNKNAFSFFKEEGPKGSIALRFTHSLSGVAASLLAGLDDDAFGVLLPAGS